MRTALITGGSRGIGASVAEVFARAGYTVIINYCQSVEAAQALEARLRGDGLDAALYRADVADPAQVREMVAFTAARYRRIDALVCCAGIAESRLITDVTNEQYRRMVDVNLGGTFFACRETARVMVPAGRGSIVNISSMWGAHGAACECLYSATKAGVIGLTKALAKELGPSGIRVNCILPGAVETDMLAGYDDETKRQMAQETALGRLAGPGEIAEIALYLADSASYVTGQAISADGGR